MNNLINPVIFLQEQWLPITELVVPNIQPWYQISTFGRIYSSKSNIILSNYIDKDGYCVVCLYRKDLPHITRHVHRLVLLTFNYISDHKNFQVNHEDDIKNDNFSINLSWCTPQENVLHAFSTGLRYGLCGENNPTASISNIQAEEIARLLSLQIYKYKEIADIVGCSENVVESICNGYTWKEYYDKYNLNEKRESGVFTNNQLHYICKYFQDHINDNLSRKNLYINALNGLGISYKDSLRKTMERILTKKRFNSITSLYNY